MSVARTWHLTWIQVSSSSSLLFLLGLFAFVCCLKKLPTLFKVFYFFTPISSAPASPDRRSTMASARRQFLHFFLRGQFVTCLTTDGLTKKKKKKKKTINDMPIFGRGGKKERKSCEQTNLAKNNKTDDDVDAGPSRQTSTPPYCIKYMRAAAGHRKRVETWAF